MTSAYCPAHITCFFSPAPSENIIKTGSVGIGIRLKAGTTVHVDEIRGSTRVVINGMDHEAKITRHVLEHMALGRNFDVTVECDLPLGQGFGMSASGAVATALCIAEILGKSRTKAFEAAHIADVVCGGGLGDVAGLMCDADVPIRIKAGFPPLGEVKGAGFSFDNLTVAVLGEKLSTAAVLGDADVFKKIDQAGEKAMSEFAEYPGDKKGAMFKLSNSFSSEAGVRGSAVNEAILRLEKNGIRSAMCMLGNSIFTDARAEEVSKILGSGNVFSTSSTNEPARIIQTM